MDHTLSNLNSLYTHQGMPIVLVGDGNLVRLLPEGTSTIMVNEEAEGQHCGIVPLTGPVTVSSSGLRWDMGVLTRTVHLSRPSARKLALCMQALQAVC